MPIFQKSIVDKYLETLDAGLLDKAYDSYKEVYSAQKIQRIKKLKEEQYQGGFLKDIFGSVLGYTIDPEVGYNIELEKKNETNAKKADGAIVQDEKVLGVIELKSNTTKNLESIKDQAFGYKNNHKGCKYVISSNFHKLRFYVDDATEYEEFDLYNLDKETFKKFYLYLRKEGLLDKNIPKLLKEETKFHEENISKQLYKDYSIFKNKFFENIVKNNPQYDKLLLFKKSQKFLDRILFVLFAEDKELIPTNAISRIVESWALAGEMHYKPLYELFTILFEHLNVGHTYKSGYEIPAYNGGLFSPDEILDNLKVDDEILKDDLLTLSKYDFNTDVDVNILGHIFEHSLSEIEEIEAQLKGEVADKTKGKRKKDGVFYTPKYITKYIVDNTVGKLCFEKKEKLGLDRDFDVQDFQKSKGTVNAKGKELFHTLELYKEWLLSLKILDPACGSGAFLNQALSFLIEEHKNIDDLVAELTNSPLRIFDTDKAILENNIFGVDINDESVEIAKLSLWLRTAQKGRKLSNLNNNIKCGNSLVDDLAVAGDKAFKWEEEFAEIFEKGGFDAVIGNPPYVRADSPGNLLPFREHMVSNGKYDTLKGKWDLYMPFIELSNNLIKTKGHSSLIIPDAYCHADYSTKSLELYKKNNFLDRIDYYPDIEVFANVGVKSVIVSFIKDKEDSKFTRRIHKEDLTFTENRLDKYPKSFRLDYTDSLIEKVKNAVNINDVLYLSKGIVGNSCEKKYKGEFKVGDLLSNEKNEVHSKLYYEGKNIDKWSLDSERWVEYNNERSPKKWSRKGFPEFFEANKIVVMRSPGRTPRAFLDKQKGIFNESAIGFVRWSDLKGVDNKSISKSYNNEKERDQFEQLSESFTLDYLIAIMNSNLIKYELNADRRSNIHIYPDDWRKIKIVVSDSQRQAPYIKLVEKIREDTFNLNSLGIKFTKYLNVHFSLEDLPKKLQKWNELEFGDFIKELNKAIKKAGAEKLTKMDEMEWMDVFETKKEEAQVLKQQINQTDKEIDQMVYKLYGLTEEEIQIVENS